LHLPGRPKNGFHYPEVGVPAIGRGGLRVHWQWRRSEQEHTVSGRGKAVLRSVAADYFAGLNALSHSPIPLPQVKLVPPKWCKHFNRCILQ